MKKSFGLILILLTFISLGGCQQESKNKTTQKIDVNSKLYKTVSKCHNSTKCNVEKWSFDADAVATIYEDEGKTLVAQHHLFNCTSGNTEIKIDSLRAGGSVHEELKANDKLTLDGMLCSHNTTACAAARLKVYGMVFSSLNSLLDDQTVEMDYLTMEDKGGSCCHILEAKGNILACCRDNSLFSDKMPTDTVKVWVEDETGLIKRIWIGYLKNPKTNEYGYMAANVSNYMLQKNGMKLPTSIEFVPSDSKAGDSGKASIKIDMERFRFNEEVTNS